MKEGPDRRALLKQALAAAVAGTEFVRAQDVKADIKPEIDWYTGIAQLIEMTERKKLEHGDKFMLFEKGGYRWADQKFKRTLVTLDAQPIDWRAVREQAAIDGPVSKIVDIHVHGNNAESPGGPAGRAKKFITVESSSVPSTVDLRSLIATRWLIDTEKELDGLPPLSVRARPMRLTSLVLNVQNKQGWYYELLPESTIRTLYPDIRLEGLVYSKDSADFVLRELALTEAKDEFEVLSLDFKGNVRAMRQDSEGEKKYQALMKAYANLGVLLRHVTWEELQKEPPGAGVLYKKQ